MNLWKRRAIASGLLGLGLTGTAIVMMAVDVIFFDWSWKMTGLMVLDVILIIVGIGDLIYADHCWQKYQRHLTGEEE